MLFSKRSHSQPESPSASATPRPTLLRFATACAASLITLAAAHAQLTPDRLYYGINRPVPMTVKQPEGLQGDLKIELLSAPDSEVVESVPVAPGPIDLAEKLPLIWTTNNPRLLYAQLSVGDKRVGPAVVLQPMISPAYAQMTRTGPQFPDEATRQKAYCGIRAYVEKHVLLSTSKGDIEIALRPDEAPNTVWNFRELVAGGFYTDIIFHRIVPTHPSGKPFVIQAGDPRGRGDGGPGYFIDLEPSKLPHDFGVLSMARSGDPNSNGSQFFLCLSREATRGLDAQYTAFGQTVNGTEAILAIGAVQVNADKPIDPPIIKTATLIDAPPRGEAPKPVTDPSGSASPR